MISGRANLVMSDYREAKNYSYHTSGYKYE